MPRQAWVVRNQKFETDVDVLYCTVLCVCFEFMPKTGVGHGVWVRKRHLLNHLYINAIFSPRQARDKHRENSKTDYRCRFLREPTGAQGTKTACAETGTGTGIFRREYTKGTVEWCEKRHLLREPFIYIKAILLPRQARDKHRKS